LGGFKLFYQHMQEPPGFNTYNRIQGGGRRRPRVTLKKGRLEVALQDVSRMCVHLFRRSALFWVGGTAK
jgi:hypothetical protein